MALDFESRIDAFEKLGIWLDSYLNEAETQTFSDDYSFEFHEVVERQAWQYGWFTLHNIRCALTSIRDILQTESLSKLKFVYGNILSKMFNPQRVAVVGAGIFPASAFYDFMMVLLTGNSLILRLQKDDSLLVPALAKKLIFVEPDFAERIEFVDRISDFDKIIVVEESCPSTIIAEYFSRCPIWVHKRQRAVAILTGNETSANLKALSEDICRYFGASYRSVTKLYVPRKYNFSPLLQAIRLQSENLNAYNAFLSNLEYQKGIALLNSIPFLDAGPMIVMENEALFAPKSVLHYVYYDKMEEVVKDCETYSEEISCIVAQPGISPHYVPFGDTYLHDFQSNMVVSDIIDFLLG